MASAVGLTLAAGGVAIANDVAFAPLAGENAASLASSFNWRIIPATIILAAMLKGFEQVSPQFAKTLGGLILLTVLMVPTGGGGTPLENIANLLTENPVTKAVTKK